MSKTAENLTSLKIYFWSFITEVSFTLANSPAKIVADLCPTDHASALTQAGDIRWVKNISSEQSGF